MEKEGRKVISEKDNLLNIISSVIKAIDEKDIFTIKEMSNRTVHSASIFQDPNSISIAVIVYSLSKIYEREKYSEYKDWKNFEKLILTNLKNAFSNINANRTEEFSQNLKLILDSIKKLSGHLKGYIEDVFRKARINKASRLYEHGISVEQTAKLLGVTVFEMAEYAGKTGIADVDLSITMPEKERIKIAIDFFEL
jgi:hypothetical protein